MRDIIEYFELGPYVGLAVQATSETDYINQLVNTVIDGSVFEFSQDALAEELPRVERDLRAGLKAADKPIGAFCHINGITEDQLPEFLLDMMKRTAAENLVIEAIADAERIRVTDKDLADYKRTYRVQYARMLLDDPKTSDEELKLAIMTKKVLSFLMENNTWRKEE